jgi:hypothetical protein
MRFNDEISLQGRFKFSVYASGGKLKYATDYVPNFITSTGLTYPSVYAFADCFRYVSLGTSNTANSILASLNGGWGTTGLTAPVNAYSYIGGKDCAGTSQYEPNTCGFLEQSGMLRLSRGWRVPAAVDTYFTSAVTYREFMVTPGRPFIYDQYRNSWGCHCYEYNDDYGITANDHGLDGSSIAYGSLYSKSLCYGDKAFARVLKDISVSIDDYLIITYDLDLYFQTGIHDLAFDIVNSTSVTNWTGALHGKGNLVHHGLKLIADGITDYTTFRPQLTTVEYGESFIPAWGAPLEPSCPVEKIAAYFSTDVLQFLVNRVSGGRYAVESASVLPTPVSGSGVMNWHSTPTTEMYPDFQTRLENVRRRGDLAYFPDPTDYRIDAISNDLVNGMGDYLYVDTITNTNISQVAMLEPPDIDAKHIASRYRTGTLGFEFFGNNHILSDQGRVFVGLPGNRSSPIRSLVLAYYDNYYVTYIPFFDVLFENREARYPGINTTNKTIELPLEEYEYGPLGSYYPSGYFYQELGGQITPAFIRTWYSPCQSVVAGC